MTQAEGRDVCCVLSAMGFSTFFLCHGSAGVAQQVGLNAGSALVDLTKTALLLDEW